jgi:spore coat polysaccharide biosynthesis protein SpsF
MSSQRFPGKVLAALPTADDDTLTVVDWTVQRVRAAPGISSVVLATSTDVTDDPLVAHCEERGIATYRGSLDDVLDRCYQAAAAHGADVVVRITADCPLADPGVVAEVVRAHLERGAEFTANRLPPPAPRRYPIGLDVEVAEMSALHRAWREATRPHEREHVMPYLYESPGRFRTAAVECPVDAGTVRWTVDTPADLQAVQALVTAAGATLATSWRALLDVWNAHPEFARLNAGIAQRDARTVDPRARAGRGDATGR